MKTKASYIAPAIDLIALDKDISLQLASDPDPMGEPGDWVQHRFGTDPLSDKLV